MSFTHLNVFLKNQKKNNVLWYINIVWHSNFRVHKYIFLEHSHAHSFIYTWLWLLPCHLQSCRAAAGTTLPLKLKILIIWPITGLSIDWGLVSIQGGDGVPLAVPNDCLVPLEGLDCFVLPCPSAWGSTSRETQQVGYNGVQLEWRRKPWCGDCIACDVFMLYKLQ